MNLGHNKDTSDLNPFFIKINNHFLSLNKFILKDKNSNFTLTFYFYYLKLTHRQHNTPFVAPFQNIISIVAT